MMMALETLTLTMRHLSWDKGWVSTPFLHAQHRIQVVHLFTALLLPTDTYTVLHHAQASAAQDAMEPASGALEQIQPIIELKKSPSGSPAVFSLVARAGAAAGPPSEQTFDDFAAGFAVSQQGSSRYGEPMPSTAATRHRLAA